ncbi:predicted protein [Micromonas commoda]|uniref:Sister chromatid cohesion protein DCC1 n=1 Tax=Micromonas commoda (strain RCC299 / NOUM17 / CCMP2709) TaxID=296587 RepID=C1EF92_MICCC|nr:predicted protein [Micromonas commoda]ACO67050.1 predicted protein [Micromonas commoda]|eukprot:XP_002505792.1 predicted protein [Micromonas commoda]
MDDDPPQGLGWFAEAHNLQEGEKANVVLGEDFHTNEVELLNLNDELLKVIEDGGELMFKGGPDDEAVLCTDRTTYAVTRVETSNTLLLFQPPGGLPTKVRLPDGTVDDIDADADDPDDRDPTVTPLPKRRKTDDDATGADGDGPPSTPAEAINRAMKDGVPLGEDGLKDIVSFAQASSHLEVVKCEPRLGPMWERLRQAPHAYAGPEREAEEETPDGDAPGADGGDGGDRTRGTRGIEEEDLVENTQASRAEIVEALAKGPAFRDPTNGDRWRGIDEAYADHILDMLVATAKQQGMSLDAVDEAAVTAAMAADDPPTPAAVTLFVLREYAEAQAPGGAATAGGESPCVWKIDAKKVCRAKASRMLEGSKAAAAGRLRLGEFLADWSGRCDEELRSACTRDLLKGLALIEKGASGRDEDALVRVFRDVDLPKNPRDRFRAIFALKPRWQMDELDAYVAATSDETVEAQLLKYTRVSQPTADAVPIYSKR